MTKVFWGGPKPTQIGLHRKHLYDCCHSSLKRLQVDYLDLFVCHRPDCSTAIEETVATMHQLTLQGKILYWGTSEWSALEIMEAMMVAEKNHLSPPILEQFQYNMFNRNRAELELLPLFIKRKLAATTTVALGGGLLTGKYIDHTPTGTRYHQFKDLLPYIMAQFDTKELNSKLKELKLLADHNNVTLAQLAIAWVLNNQHIASVILGVATERQLMENLHSLTLVENLLDKGLLMEIEGILANQPINKELLMRESFFNYEQLRSLV